MAAPAFSFFDDPPDDDFDFDLAADAQHAEAEAQQAVGQGDCEAPPQVLPIEIISVLGVPPLLI